MRIFLTGGTGLVGSHVAEHLVANGHEVRALVRAGSEGSFLRTLGVELREGDVTDAASLAGAMSDCDGLVHAAAIVTARVDWEIYRLINVAGTENVLAAAAGQGVRRAVHVSSVAVYGGDAIVLRGGVDEDASTQRALPPGELYGRSKREAEAAAWRVHQDGALQVTMVRPDVIYGERDRVVIPLFARYLGATVVLTVGRGNRELPVVYAGNVAQGILAALTTPVAAGRVYNLASDFAITQREFFRLIAEELGARPIMPPLPYAVAAGGAWLAEWIGELRNRRPVVSRRHVAFMGRGNPFVSQRAQEELGWQPRVRHEEGIRRAVKWYRDSIGNSR
jgi:nucleoside-diphosphate-sugar epimerase